MVLTFFFFLMRPPPTSTLFPYTTLFRSIACPASPLIRSTTSACPPHACATASAPALSIRSEEHTSELQSQSNLVCRLLLEKKNIRQENPHRPHIKQDGTKLPRQSAYYCL